MTLSEISEILYCVNQCKNQNKQTRKDPKYKILIESLDNLYNEKFAKFYIEADKYYFNGKECVINKHESNYCHIVTISQNGFGYKNTSRVSQCVMYSDLTKPAATAEATNDN